MGSFNFGDLSNKFPLHQEAEVPGWGGSVLVRRLSLKERVKFSSQTINGLATANGSDSDSGSEKSNEAATEYMVSCICKMVCDDDGTPWEEKEGAREWLEAEDPQLIIDLALKCMEINRLTSRSKQKEIDEAKKE